MNRKDFSVEVITEAKKRDLIPNIPLSECTPIPAIHKVEWDLTFHCNDHCMHCVTDSGPECNIFTKTSDAIKIMDNIQKYNIIRRIKNLYVEKVEFEFRSSPILEKLEKKKKPPIHLDDRLSESYLECLHGTNYYTILKTRNDKMKLNFGRPHIRLSGGEFFTWPKNKFKVEDERLKEQSKFLKKLRQTMPEYDIWILTNGRFAVSDEKSDEVIGYWSENLGLEDKTTGKTRICISTDLFHSPPQGSTIEQMLKRMWNSCFKHGLSAPFLYGIHGREIYYAGRAFDKMNVGKLKNFNNVSRSDFNPQKNYTVTTKDLIETDGCNELKGFFVEIRDKGFIPVNNININPEGHLMFCCAQVGDYGDFINYPEIALKNIIRNPIAFMMRKKETVIPFLNLVAEMDPTIKVYGSGKHPAVVSSTCYQMLSEKRKD